MEFFIVFGIVFNFGNPLYARAYGFTMLQPWAVYTIAAAIYLVIYAFKAIGLSTMAKKAGKNKLVWCAFVPFASTFLMGELAGEMRLGGNAKLKHIGLYAMVLEVLLCVCYALQYFPQTYIFAQGEGVLYNIVTETNANGTYISIEFTGSLNPAIVQMMNVALILEYIFYLLYTLAAVFLFIAFFRRYCPASYIWMVILCAILPVLTAFLIFAYRNRLPVDYERFMAARAEQYRRMQQSQYGPYGGNPYGGNPYGGGYGSPYGQNPNAGPYGGQGAPREPEDPFGEFSSKSGGESDPFGEFSEKKGTGNGNSGTAGNGTEGSEEPKNGGPNSSDDFFS